jgi:Zn-dependent protease
MALLASLLIFFSAVVIHECSHAFVAYKLGDPTAKRMGRLTLNPIAHIDPFGTVVLPILLILMNAPVLFGWAKPVPINFANLHNPKRDMIWVGLAGPASNLLFAFIASLLLKAGLKSIPVAAFVLESMMVLNVVLAVFNLIPLPPLDGSRVLVGLLPMPFAMFVIRIERYGFLILFTLLYMGLFNKVVWPIALHILSFLAKL